MEEQPKNEIMEEQPIEVMEKKRIDNGDDNKAKEVKENVSITTYEEALEALRRKSLLSEGSENRTKKIAKRFSMASNYSMKM